MCNPIKNIIYFLKNKSYKIYANATRDVQTQTSNDDLSIEIYSDDFESSTSPYPSPKRNRIKDRTQ